MKIDKKHFLLLIILGMKCTVYGSYPNQEIQEQGNKLFQQINDLPITDDQKSKLINNIEIIFQKIVIDSDQKISELTNTVMQLICDSKILQNKIEDITRKQLDNDFLNDREDFTWVFDPNGY